MFRFLRQILENITQPNYYKAGCCIRWQHVKYKDKKKCFVLYRNNEPKGKIYLPLCTALATQFPMQVLTEGDNSNAVLFRSTFVPQSKVIIE